MQKIKLFCFPYAGGSSVLFKEWAQFLNVGIELIPIELAGRGSRMREPLYKCLNDMVEDVYGIIENQIKVGIPYALFGHSMGALLAFELARKIRQNGLDAPVHIFFSGRRAPHLPGRPKGYHQMSMKEFKEEVIKLGGTPAGFFDSPELVDIFVPIMRNDFRLAESPIPLDDIEPFSCGLSIFIGKEEDITAEEAVGWIHHSTKNCSIHYFQGGHFFLHDEKVEMLRLLNQALPQKLVSAVPVA